MAAKGGGAGVCPMRLGAGIQNKLLEYMALGLPAVSTTIGLEGLSARPGLELEVADEPETFSRHLIDLLSDRARAEAMAILARNYVAAHHSWKIVSTPMVQAINDRLAAVHPHGRVAPPATEHAPHRLTA
jgi:glycosyltransferase involved in cell wall biosynthesis